MPRPTYTTEAQKRGQSRVAKEPATLGPKITLDKGTQPGSLPAGADQQLNTAGATVVRALGMPVPLYEINAKRVLQRDAIAEIEPLEELSPTGGRIEGTLSLKGRRTVPREAEVDAELDVSQDNEIDYDAERARDEDMAEGGAVQTLLGYLKLDNIAPELDEDTLARLGQKVIEEYQIDVTSRSEWKAKNDKAMKLAKQVVESKNYPWPKASNIKYPAITVAAMQYNARAYTAIVNDNLVKAKVNGYDPHGEKAARAERVGKTLSWQCMEEMEEWDEEMDQLLLVLPIVGMDFKKTYYDSSLGRNVSERVTAENLVWNYKAKNFYRCPRKTHEIDYYPYEIKEQVAAGLFKDIDFGMAIGSDNNDPDSPHRFLEQHRFEDLDGDGYPEPYIVTVHEQTMKVVRIVCRFYPEDIQVRNNEVTRIKPCEYFTKFGFLPNPDGSAHDIGFGVLMGPLNVAINRVINMMMDSGHLANTQGGLIGSGLRMKGGAVRLKPGEFKPVDVGGAAIRENLVQIQYPGPQPAMFSLLEFLIGAANDIGAIKDILSGEQSQANMPAASVLALIEQGLKTQTAINKRVHRSLKREFRRLYELDGRYMPPQKYITFLDADKPVQVLLNDFRGDDLDISPAADPKVLTDMQEITRAEAILPFAKDPDFNGLEIKLRYLRALGIPDVDQLRANPKAKAQQQMMQMRMLMEEMQNRREEVQAKLIKAKSGALKDHTGAIKDLADAEAANEQMQNEIAYYEKVVEQLSQVLEGIADGREQRQATGPQAGAQPGGMGVPGGQRPVQ